MALQPPRRLPRPRLHAGGDLTLSRVIPAKAGIHPAVGTGLRRYDNGYGSMKLWWLSGAASR